MKAVAYARVSTVAQGEEGYSLPAQVKLFFEYATGKGIEIVAPPFVETASAYHPDARKEFRKMVDYLKQHPDVDGVLCYRVNRLSRNMSDFSVIIEGLGKKVFSIAEEFSDSATGRFMGHIHSLISWYESAVKSEQTALGMREKARQGYWPTGAPIGYRNIPEGNGIEPDLHYGPLLVRLFELAATGNYTLQQLRSFSAEMGIKTVRAPNKPSPAQFVSKSNVLRILRNPIYYGPFYWKRELCQGNHEPLISEGLWFRVQQALDGRTNHKIKGKKLFAFKGLMSCGYCNSTITVGRVKGNGGAYVYYWCNRYLDSACSQPYMRENILADRLAEALLPLQWPPSLKDNVYLLLKDLVSGQGASHEQEILLLERQCAELEEKLSQGMEKYLERKVPENLWLQKSNEWQQKLHHAKTRIASLKGGFPAQSLDRARILIGKMTNLYEEYLQEKDWFKRSEMLKQVVLNLKVTREKIVPVYKKPYDLLAKFPEIECWEG